MLLQYIDYQIVARELSFGCFQTEKSDNFCFLYNGKELVGLEM